MKFLDREDELARLETVLRRREGSLSVVWGRRRIGKTRLLVEWCRRNGGIYMVADQSAPDLQRAHAAEAIARLLPGFADVTYPDWRRLLERLAREARASKLRGPVVFDEFPYLVLGSPELPSVLQRFIDHDARDARLVVALAGSSQRMMQGLVLDANAPLYGRASVLMDLAPLHPKYLREALGPLSAVELVEHYAAWGGVPRYWELAASVRGSAKKRLLRLALDPLGPLHTEPEHVLLEEVPAASEVRPLLDAIGGGAHRLSEIAGRLGRPATSLARPLQRLASMGLISRDVPFGEPERSGKRSIYRIDDPFFKLWFRIVAPHRAALVVGPQSSRAKLLDEAFDPLVASAWEELCRRLLPEVAKTSRLGRLGPWRPAQRWWRGSAPEWDVVSRSLQGDHFLVGEARFTRRSPTSRHLRHEAARLALRPLPEPLVGRGADVVRVLLVPSVPADAPRRIDDVLIVTASELLGIALP